MKSHLLGLDIGTGGTRAVVVNGEGRVVSSATCDHVPFDSPRPGWAEQNPHDWWRATVSAIRAVLARAGLAGRDVACVGLAGQMHGAVLLDANDAVLRPTIIWCDQRSQRECDWLTLTVGPERLIQLTCNPALTNFTLTKLLWVRSEEPHVWERFTRFLLPKDYIRLRLTGEHVTDMADASGTLMLGVAHRRWSLDIMQATGLPESCLPRVLESPEISARVSDDGAATTGLWSGNPGGCGAGG